jgi:hypothetical protein
LSRTEGSIGCKICYDISDNTPDESVEKFFPVRVQVEDEGHVLTAWGLFESQSERLKHCVSNLLSRDVAVVNSTMLKLSIGFDLDMYLLNFLNHSMSALNNSDLMVRKSKRVFKSIDREDR